ncbi:MAG: hypothetical protein HY397_03245 [Candidatus Doudnabacteria bacterium]|nr:hypothetical protein [Candidatus Doudnabacteria bacterium]
MGKFTLNLIILLLLLYPSILLAAGIQVSPSKLDLVVTSNNASSVTLTVTNPTADVQVFEVYPEEFSELISVNPQSFTLEAGDQKTVTVTAKSDKKQSSSQTLKTNLAILANPLADSRFQAATGAKIPLSIKMEEDKGSAGLPRWTFYAYVGAVAAGGLWYFWWHRRKKQQTPA